MYALNAHMDNTLYVHVNQLSYVARLVTGKSMSLASSCADDFMTQSNQTLI